MPGCDSSKLERVLALATSRLRLLRFLVNCTISLLCGYWIEKFRSAILPEKSPSILGHSAAGGGGEECTARVAAAAHRTKTLSGRGVGPDSIAHQIPTHCLLNIIPPRPFPAEGQRKKKAARHTRRLRATNNTPAVSRASAISTHSTTTQKCGMAVGSLSHYVRHNRGAALRRGSKLVSPAVMGLYISSARGPLRVRTSVRAPGDRCFYIAFAVA